MTSEITISESFVLSQTRTSHIASTPTTMFAYPYSLFAPSKPEPCIISMSSFSSRSDPPSYYTNTTASTSTESPPSETAAPPPANTNSDVENNAPRRQTCSKLFSRLWVAFIILVAIAALVLLIYYAHRADQKHKAEVAACVESGGTCDTVKEDDNTLLLWTASLGWRWW
jgi:hypothetical protein